MVVEGSTSNAFRTYKRRKERLQSDGHFSNDETSVNAERTKQSQSIDLCSSCGQNGLAKMDVPRLQQSSVGCVHEQWRNTVLENMSRLLDASEGGIQSCIHYVLASSRCGSAEMSKLHGTSEKTAQIHELLKEPKIPFGSQNGSMEHMGSTSDGSRSKPNEEENTMTLHCQRVFHDLIVSEKFSLLCKLLCENFQGIKVDNFTDFNVIDSRMREGAYKKSPMLFFADIQLVWQKFQKIGTEMVSLARGLSDMSRKYYNEQVGGLGVNGVCGEEKHEVTKPQRAEASGLATISTCRRCGAKADGKDCLICDSCEEIYHISCIEPVVEEIPPRYWYCANCTASGIEPSHENCVVCQRLNEPISQSQAHVGLEISEPITNNLRRDLEDKSTSMGAKDVSQSSRGSGIMGVCKICRIKVGGEQRIPFRSCGHIHCPQKYYHLRCLTVDQLKTYGSCWYCPSCLCRSCLTDKDDDKIVLCDACDDAYHIYCMTPPRTSIPRGKWFCKDCDAGIRTIRKARLLYTRIEKRERNSQLGGVKRAATTAVGSEDMLQKNGKFAVKREMGSVDMLPKNGKLGGLKRAVGSVDMLLSAAEKLNSEEKLAAAVTGPK